GGFRSATPRKREEIAFSRQRVRLLARGTTGLVILSPLSLSGQDHLQTTRLLGSSLFCALHAVPPPLAKGEPLLPIEHRKNDTNRPGRYAPRRWRKDAARPVPRRDRRAAPICSVLVQNGAYSTRQLH